MSVIKEKIFQSTLELISERGFHDAPISKIAKHAKISQGSIYNYFENKDDPISKLYISIKIRLAEITMKNIDFSVDPRTVFHQVWMNVAEFYTDYKVEADFLKYYENTPKPEQVPEFYHIIQPLFDYIEDLKSKGTIRNLPLLVIIVMVGDLVKSLVELHLKGQMVLTDAILEYSFQACWNGIRSPYS